MTSDESVDYKALLSELRRSSTDAPEMAVRPGYGRGYVIGGSAAMQSVRQVLEASATFRKGCMIRLGGGWVAFHADWVADSLGMRVKGGESPEEAVEWLRRVLCRTSARGRYFMAIYGLEVSEAIPLSHGIDLIPFVDIPDSLRKQSFFPTLESTRFAAMSPFHWSAPKAALTVQVEVEPLLHPGAQGETPSTSNGQDENLLLYDSMLALSLVGPSCPIEGGTWFEFDEPDLREGVLGSGISRKMNNVLPWWPGEEVRLASGEAREIVSTYLMMTEPLRTRLRLSLERFNTAMRHAPHGDRALDLAISLESILVDEAGELTYKVGLRTALLLGGAAEERQYNRNLTRALYDLRSQLVHDGKLPPEKRVKGFAKRPSADLVREATVTCARALRAILLRGAIPDWDRYELEGEDDRAPWGA